LSAAILTVGPEKSLSQHMPNENRGQRSEDSPEIIGGVRWQQVSSESLRELRPLAKMSAQTENQPDMIPQRRNHSS